MNMPDSFINSEAEWLLFYHWARCNDAAWCHVVNYSIKYGLTEIQELRLLAATQCAAANHYREMVIKNKMFEMDNTFIKEGK